MLVYSSVEDHVFPGGFPVPLAKQTTWQSCNRIANDVMTIANTAVEEAKFATCQQKLRTQQMGDVYDHIGG